MKFYYLPFMNQPECPLLDYIKSGEKTVEGRKNSTKYQKMKKGDIIIFKTKNEDDVYATITYVKKYKTLEDYLKTETLEKALPCAKTIEEGIKIYDQWSSQKDRDYLQKKFGYGFLGIGIKVLNEEEINNLQKYVKYKTKYLNSEKKEI